MAYLQTTFNRCFYIRPINNIQYSHPPVPLTALQISADIQKFLATVSLTQFFRNIENSPIECEYLFPIDDFGVVTSISIQFDDGREIIADIEEKKAAQEHYNEAIRHGDSAMLVNKSDPDRMILNIGNLPPHSRAVVRLTYVTPLVTSNEHWRFVIPLALTPRYQMDRTFNDGDDTDFTWVRAADCPYTVGFKISIVSDTVIQGLYSPSHSIETQLSNDAKSASIQLDRTRSYVPDRDFILSFYTQDAYTPRAIVQELNGRYAAMLSFVPKFLEQAETEDDLEGSGEFIFVLDRSGSMSGSRINMAIEAAQLFLKSLPANSIFNIISFGSQFSGMFKESVEYNTQTLNQALNTLSRYTANMGGTEICKPLEYVFNQQFSAQHPRTLFLITDGEVGSPETVVNLVGDNVGKSRVHTIGIGEGVSAYLIKEVAKAGKGTASFVTKNEEIKLTVINALKRAIQPSFTNWSVDISGEAVPDKNHLSTLYYNEPFIMYAMMNNIKNEIISLTCWNTRYSRRESFSIMPDEIYNIPGDSIHKLWAKHRITDLEREIKRGSRLESTVINLSLQYKVPSSHTSYIAIERRLDKVHGYMQQRTIPIASTCDSDMPAIGYHPMKRKAVVGGSRGGSRGGIMLKTSSMPMARSQMVKAEKRTGTLKYKKNPHKTSGACLMEIDMMEGSAQDELMSLEDEESYSSRGISETSSRSFTGYMPIVSLQEAQGFWNESALGSLIAIPSISPQISVLPESSLIWATIIALAYLEKHFSEYKGEWELVAKKAKRWLRSKSVTEELFNTLISALA